MNYKSFLYIANWKAYFTHSQALNWLTKYALQLKAYEGSLILCPDTTLLVQARALLPSSMLGAQDCSAFKPGAHTGEITAATLASCGVSCCIVGHYERRAYNHEDQNIVAEKIMRLLENNITPIVCVSNEFKIELEYVIQKTPSDYIVAYEPPSSIGTGKPLEREILVENIQQIKQLFADNGLTAPRVVYGGSVNAENAQEFKNIVCLDGVLIGKASTDFQELKKIVE